MLRGAEGLDVLGTVLGEPGPVVAIDWQVSQSDGQSVLCLSFFLFFLSFFLSFSLSFFCLSFFFISIPLFDRSVKRFKPY